MAHFRHLRDTELAKLSDEEILDYVQRARQAGEDGAAITAMQILVFGYMDTIEKRVRLKIPEHAVDEVAGAAFLGALLSIIRGRKIDDFRAWLNKVVDNHIANWHRKKRLDVEPLVSEHEGDEDVWGEVPQTADETGAVILRNAVARVLAELNRVHQDVVDVRVFEGVPAAETAERINQMHPTASDPMTEDNVHQIATRFRKRLREILEEGDTCP